MLEDGALDAFITVAATFCDMRLLSDFFFKDEKGFALKGQRLQKKAYYALEAKHNTTESEHSRKNYVDSMQRLLDTDSTNATSSSSSSKDDSSEVRKKSRVTLIPREKEEVAAEVHSSTNDGRVKLKRIENMVRNNEKQLQQEKHPAKMKALFGEKTEDIKDTTPETKQKPAVEEVKDTPIDRASGASTPEDAADTHDRAVRLKERKTQSERNEESSESAGEWQQVSAGKVDVPIPRRRKRASDDRERQRSSTWGETAWAETSAGGGESWGSTSWGDDCGWQGKSGWQWKRW